MNSEVDSRERLWGHYRVFRRGIITLPHLESVLKHDRKELHRMIDSQQVADAESSFAIQSMEIIREVAEDTLHALNGLTRLLGETATLDDAKLEELVSKTVLDPKTRTRILRTARWNGGVRQMFETAHRQISLKQQTFADAVGIARGGDAPSLKAAFRLLEEHDVAMERLREEWRNKLKEGEEADCQELRFELLELKMGLCQQYPDIAHELGVDCAYMGVIPVIWPLVLFLVVVLVCCAGPPL